MRGRPGRSTSSRVTRCGRNSIRATRAAAHPPRTGSSPKHPSTRAARTSWAPPPLPNFVRGSAHRGTEGIRNGLSSRPRPLTGPACQPVQLLGIVAPVPAGERGLEWPPPKAQSPPESLRQKDCGTIRNSGERRGVGSHAGPSTEGARGNGTMCRPQTLRYKGQKGQSSLCSPFPVYLRALSSS